MDVYSRYVVGWMVAYRESASLAVALLAATCRKQNIKPGELTVHADNGSSMTSLPVAQLLADLGITKTHSRPRVSNDNPYSESAFKTLKYRPDFSERFETIEHARSFCCLTVFKARATLLAGVYAVHPERFVNGGPIANFLPGTVWINKPKTVPQILVANS